MKPIFRELVLAAVILVSPLFAIAADTDMERAQRLLKPFKQGLQEALRTGLKQGPVAAISACNLQAPAIATGLSHSGVQVGRSSHRLRNPANRAPRWVAPTLDAYVSGAALQPTLLQLDSGQLGYIEPIVLQPLCTACHGKTLAEPVAAKLRDLYPRDRATGFSPGDFRGVFWMEFPADPNTP